MPTFPQLSTPVNAARMASRTCGVRSQNPPTTSSTVTVIVCMTVSARVPVPLMALTVTMYSLLSASLAGSVLATSAGFSKSGAVWKLSTPLIASIWNCA